MDDDVEGLLSVHERERGEELRERLGAITVKEGMIFTGISRLQVYYLRVGQLKPTGKCTDAVLAAVAPCFAR